MVLFKSILILQFKAIYMKLIIMAGGQGTKLWPYSRVEKPKQFQSIQGEKSLFQNTVEDLLEGFKVEDIFIATKKRYVDLVKKQTPMILKNQIIAEPDAKKDMGPANIYAALKVESMYPGVPFMVIQSDVLRSPNKKFLEMISDFEKTVLATRKLLTGGIRPSYPAMGVDYIRLGNKHSSNTNTEFYEVEKFVPRLDSFKETKELIENFHVVTHANFHCWFSDELMEATKKYRPNWHTQLSKIRESFGKKNEEQKTEKLYSEIKQAGKIEEVTSHIFEESGLMALLPFKWTDVGTWGSIHEYFTGGIGNHLDAEVVTIDTKDSLVKGKKGKVIATLGVEELIVVDTEDALLIINKERASDIGLILKNLEESGRSRYL